MKLGIVRKIIDTRKSKEAYFIVLVDVLTSSKEDVETKTVFIDKNHFFNVGSLVEVTNTNNFIEATPFDYSILTTETKEIVLDINKLCDIEISDSKEFGNALGNKHITIDTMEEKAMELRMHLDQLLIAIECSDLKKMIKAYPTCYEYER